MATIERFEDIIAWQEARELCKWVYKISSSTPLKNDLRLKDQINASSGSIMDNIAEGFELNGRKEFMRYLSYSKGSAGEVRSQLYRIYDREYITKEDFEKWRTKVSENSKRISNFIGYLKNSQNKGWRFSEPLATYQLASDEE